MLRRKLFPLLAALGATGLLKAQDPQDVTGPNGEHLRCVDIDPQTTICMAQDDNKPSDKVIWRDNTPLIGKIGPMQYASDPVNTSFKLPDMPDPVNSLQLFSDGRLLIQNMDYSLRNDGQLDILESKLAPRRSLVAWYRTTDKSVL